jgi:cellulose synthase/poly-beta-1,6-N-acetylglucosamine synthase-like glycosyltransferase
MYLLMQVFISYYVRRWRRIALVEPDRFPSPLKVLLSARDEAQTLPETLPTLLRQRLPLRVVAADDGSTDETRAILAFFLAGGRPTKCIAFRKRIMSGFRGSRQFWHIWKSM